MTGAAYSLTITGIPEAAGYLEGLSEIDLADAAFKISVLLENSTKRRIAEEKMAPDGIPWAPWSEDYAARRGEHHSLLVGYGDLRDSVQSYATGTEAIVGTNLVYAATHQFGDDEREIPDRTFLGLSERDRVDIRDLVTGVFEDVRP